DGIRDRNVTGVQTCALPILRKFGDKALVDKFLPRLTARDLDTLYQGAMFMTEQVAGSDIAHIETRAYQQDGQWRLSGDKWFCSRSEERRVGKECRSRGRWGG